MTAGALDVRIGVAATSAESSHVAACPDLGAACSGATPPAPYEHHVRMRSAEAALDASYGLTNDFALELHAPVRLVDIDPRYTELDGTPKVVTDDIHHRKETLRGPGDPWLAMRAAARLGAFVTAARIGLRAPVGATVDNPYRLGEQGLPHEHVQFGTGTWALLVGFGITYLSKAFTVDFSALGIFDVTANEHGYRAPSRAFVGARVFVPLMKGKLRPFAVVEVPHETSERWSGTASTEGGQARTDVLTGLGIVARVGDFDVDASIRGRIGSIPTGAGFVYPGILSLGIARRFDLSGERRAPYAAPLAPSTPAFTAPTR